MTEFWSGDPFSSHLSEAPSLVGAASDQVSLPSTVNHYVSAGVEGEKSERFCTKYGKCKPGEVTWDSSDQYGGKKCITRPQLGDKKYTSCDKADMNPGKCPWRRCSKIIPALHCPKFDGVLASSAAATDPAVYNGRAITCEYSRDLIGASCERVSAFTDEYRKATGDSEWFDDDMMRHVCSQRAPAGKCPDGSSKYKDPQTGEVVCSNILACPKCQEWASARPGVADTVMREWCAAHTDITAPLDPERSDPACQCINREFDPAVAELQRYSMVKPGCWYPPCATGGLKKYLRPESDAPKPKDCPDKICNIIWDLKETTAIDIGTIEQVIHCGDPPTPTPTPVPGPQPSPIPIPFPDLPVTPEQRKKLLIGGGLAVVGILVSVVVLIKMRKRPIPH